MSLTRAEVIAYLEGLSALELGDLIDELQRHLGVAVVAAQEVHVTMGMPLTTDDPAYPTFCVLVTAIGPRKIRVVQALRERLPLAPQEALRLLERLPAQVAAGLDLQAAHALMGLLREAGAQVEVV